MDYHTKKVLLNHQIFMEKLIANPEFFLEIQKWKDKLMIRDEDLGSFYDAKSEHYGEAYEYGSRLMSKVTKDKNIEFVDWLNDFCERYNLGAVWKPSLINYIACGYYCPPSDKIYIEKNAEKKLVILELESNTTKEDFDNAWDSVRVLLKELPQKPKRRFNKKSFQNLGKILLKNKRKKETGAKGLDLMGIIHEEAKDISKKADQKRLRRMKTLDYRLKKKGLQ